VAFPGQESSGVKLRNGSNNEHVVRVDMWQGARLGGARHSPRMLLEMMSLAPAKKLWWHSLHGWTLLCSSEEEVVAVAKHQSLCLVEL
jgi:hypothetical protein